MTYKLKGIDILLHAWKELGENAPKLVICGTGPMEKWCKDYVEENRLNVEMKGFVTNEEARRLMGRSKALILPTQWYNQIQRLFEKFYRNVSSTQKHRKGTL